MDIKETSLRTAEEITMLEDDEFYKYIFKKTEKMVCAVFYILRHTQSIGQNDSVVSDLEDSARVLLRSVVESLKSSRSAIDQNSITIRYALIDFESRLRIANSARILETELLQIFVHEIDSVQRTLRRYLVPTTPNPIYAPEVTTVTTRIKKQSYLRSQTTQSELSKNISRAITPSRRERVLTILRDKGEATIKDITEVVTDCSEKTIQRELIGLIKDNIIVRDGERRWSKYKLI